MRGRLIVSRNGCSRCGDKSSSAFTLIELLVVVSIIGILAAIAVPSFMDARERALMAADASNLKMIANALQSYQIDYGKFPPADREAGPFMSHSEEWMNVKNGPAAGGSWDGVPWLLYEKRYVSNWTTLFCPKYLQIYRYGTTLRGDAPRYHNFRYAYNSSALSTGGVKGGVGDINKDSVWVVRDLWLSAESGWYGNKRPAYPADYTYPWGRGRNLEYVMFADWAVKLVVGGTNQPSNE